MTSADQDVRPAVPGCRLRAWRLAAVILVLAVPGRLRAGSDEVEVFEAAAGLGRPVIWEPPGPVETLDLRHGVGGAELEPAPPFTFVKEDESGSNPKVLVTDARGLKWSVKWGSEVKAEVFCSRIVWACGYFQVPTHFVGDGRILGVHDLARARKSVGPDGTFHDARFQLRDRSLKLIDGEDGWTWDKNPFVGTRELAGLKILLMLLSNWDSKDARDEDRGSNTGIFLDERAPGVARYAFIDWGASMGRWGSLLKRSEWDCEGYTKQTRALVRGRHPDGSLRWGYSGQRSDVVAGISEAAVRWLLERAGRLSDAQIEDALAAAGATPAEKECFARAVRARVVRLAQAAGATL